MPTVDVLFATYNESISIITKTIVGCLNLEYLKDKITITLCDDGARETAKALCEKLGIQYLTRPEKSHAKAGSIDYVLHNTNGRFVALLDADMVPKSAFLQKTIGYFINDTVGFVQTPQVFGNPDPFQYNLILNTQISNEQDLFIWEIQVGAHVITRGCMWEQMRLSAAKRWMRLVAYGRHDYGRHGNRDAATGPVIPNGIYQRGIMHAPFRRKLYRLNTAAGKLAPRKYTGEKNGIL